MLLNRDKKKRKGGRYFRLALLIVILLILLVLLFGEQWGIGQGDLLRLFSRQETPSQEEETIEDTSVEDSDAYREVKVLVTGNAIQVDEMPFTLEGFDAYLVSLQENILIVLVDEEANYTLFTTIEEMIEANGISYVIEE